MRHRIALLLALALIVTPTLARAVDHNVSVGPGNVFSPQTVNINAGDRVIWTRLGGTHNVNSDTGLFGNALSSSWSTHTVTFGGTGTFGYHCEAHGNPGVNMFGTVIVTGGGGGGAGSLQFSTGSTSVGENAGTKTFTVTRTGGDNGPVSVDYETVNGSATFPGDYIQSNDRLEWADNDDNPKTFTVPIVNDSVEEPNQSFSVQLVNPLGGATIGTNNDIVVTINDDDEPSGSPGTIRFTSATAGVSESQPNVTLTAERVSGSTGPVSVLLSTANGTASAGSDYQAVSNAVLSWGNGDSSNKTLQVPIVGDSNEESNETFTATLSAPTGGATIGSPATTTVTINDDDVTCSPCVADATTLCLAGGSGDPNRFRVRVNWENFQGGTGAGFAVPFTPDSGFFYFFSPNNLELLVKMVRGCGTALNAYWFFYAAASNVGLEYEVLDTTACVTKTYSNPVGNFASFGDINALATCP
ncbi:MAG: hypothetical protein KBI44_04395 [Thermoanaerobaculia bacterium]|nr:hypothetical protein [Thermoanaerobaculia bacterium]